MFLIWLLAVVIGIAGIIALFRGQILWGVILIILAFVVGPGGYSIFKESAHPAPVGRLPHRLGGSGARRAH
jgi:uncharacterized membrane protein YdbT with pleckstrin-like domain